MKGLNFIRILLRTVNDSLIKPICVMTEQQYGTSILPKSNIDLIQRNTSFWGAYPASISTILLELLSI